MSVCYRQCVIVGVLYDLYLQNNTVECYEILDIDPALIEG